MKPEVLAAVEEFADLHPELADPCEAMGHCMLASLQLRGHLHLRGLDADVELVKVARSALFDGRSPYRNLFVLRIGDEFVDLTARQLDPKAPYPMVGSVSDLELGEMTDADFFPRAA